MAAIESYYTEKLRDFYISRKRDPYRSKSQLGNSENQNVNALMHKNELMNILSDAVEDVKKQIMRRRVKQEAMYSSRKKSIDHEVAEQASFEETMLKLVDYAKSKIKY